MPAKLEIRPLFLFLGLALLTAGAFSAGADPFIPTSDDFVLERLPAGSTGEGGRELRRLRAELALHPDDWAAASRVARKCLERARADMDPRYLGYAQGAIAPWWSMTRPPVEALVLRATIRQSNHDFAAALADLDLALKADPLNAQAWLTRSAVCQVRGEYTQARRACASLLRLAPPLVAVGTTASLASLSGDAAKAAVLLRGTIESNPAADAATRLWAITLLAEISERLGKPGEAEAGFKSALSLGVRDGYLLGAYADFLLDQNRAAEARKLLESESRVDGLLLRLALAENMERSGGAAGLAAHVNSLRERFDAARLRGDTVHRREEARYRLHLLNEPREALRLAQANWDVQREPADARILLESALAAGDAAAARPVVEWLAAVRLEDIRLDSLKQRLTRLQ
jgi:tetratricopeptide (TPR) repeat protein